LRTSGIDWGRGFHGRTAGITGNGKSRRIASELGHTGCVDNLPAAQRAIDSGADPQDLARIARAAAYETAFAMLSLLAGDEPAEGLPTWALEEIDARGQPTGRHLGGLDEDLLGLDPSGREGRDLWR
jgi:hypothetical protein